MMKWLVANPRCTMLKIVLLVIGVVQRILFAPLHQSVFCANGGLINSGNCAAFLQFQPLSLMAIYVNTNSTYFSLGNIIYVPRANKYCFGATIDNVCLQQSKFILIFICGDVMFADTRTNCFLSFDSLALHNICISTVMSHTVQIEHDVWEDAAVAATVVHLEFFIESDKLPPTTLYSLAFKACYFHLEIEFKNEKVKY